MSHRFWAIAAPAGVFTLTMLILLAMHFSSPAGASAPARTAGSASSR